MYKKIAALFATLAAVVGLTLVAAPANALQDNLNCTGPGSGDVSGRLTVFLQGDLDRFDVDGYINEGNGSHSWNWKFLHGGDFSAGGTQPSNSHVSRTMLNFNGPDTIKYRLVSANGDITCTATVIW